MTTVGLTGDLGSGKSTVLGFFGRCGAKILSADAVVHEALKKNVVLQNKIRKAFGVGVFCRGAIDRRALAWRVFKSAKLLQKLNLLVHPLVKKKIFEFLKKYRRNRGALAVVEVPLLFETGFDRFFDVTVVVAAGEEAIGRRLRHKTGDAFKERSRWQMPLKEKIARCDFVIDNSGSRKQTLDQVKNLKKLLITQLF